MTNKKPNEGQQKVIDACLDFLLDSNEKYLEVDGPAGTGKTFIQGQIIDTVLPQYEGTCKLLGMSPKYTDVALTATTNKAAEQLGRASGRPVSTIHSHLSLMVRDDFKTGKSTLSRRRDIPLVKDQILFIDEKSFIGSYQLKDFIHDYTLNCKIILFGDSLQLEPPMDVMAKWDTNYKFELTEPVRNAGQPALQELCNQLRETVRTGIFKPIQLVPGVIDQLRGDEMVKAVKQSFVDEPIDTRFIAYSNNKVNAYNNFIRKDLRGKPELYEDGEILVCNTHMQYSDTGKFSTEEEVTLVDVSSKIDTHVLDDGATLHTYKATVIGSFGDEAVLNIPTSPEHLSQLKKYFAGRKNWQEYFRLRDCFPDLRPRDASTIHKAQGSTVHTIFIDLNDLSQCNVANTVARLLYVAVSRASDRVIFYGDLPEKYGGLCS